MHDDYLLATEKLEISHDILSKHCCSIANKYGIKISGANKLVSNLVSKSKYVIHYTNLQWYLSLVIKFIISVHGVLKFQQSHC